MESIQIINTAIIKSKEKKIDHTYEARLNELCKTPALKAINKAISLLAEEQKISRDQAAIQVVDTVRELDELWTDYVMMEGLDRLKSLLKGQEQ